LLRDPIFFLLLRGFVKSEIENIFHTFCYENQYHNGIAELLEILGSIINGYGVPLREEHKDFLFETIMPLHRTRYVGLYHPQLAFCVIKYLDKDPYLTNKVVEELLKFYPKSDSAKELLFLDEIEDILSIIDVEEFESIQEIVFKQVSECIMSGRFQSAERALALWNNESILNYILDNAGDILRIVFPALHYASKHHWHKAIRSLATTVLKLFLEISEYEFAEVVQNFKKEQEMKNQKNEQLKNMWNELLAQVQPEINGLTFNGLEFPHDYIEGPIHLKDLVDDSTEDEIIEVPDLNKEILPMNSVTLQALLNHHIETSSSEYFSDSSEEISGNTGYQSVTTSSDDES